MQIYTAIRQCRYIQSYGSADIYSDTAVQIYTVIRQCRYIQSYGSADIYSHTAGILSSRHLLILRAHTATAHLSFQTITRSLIPVYTTRNLL